MGLVLLSFTSVYREGFEIVIFLHGLRVALGSAVVLEGVLLGLLFTAAVGVLTFGLHQRAGDHQQPLVVAEHAGRSLGQPIESPA